MFQITGGKYKGSKLILPPEHVTRPTSSRAREALFNCLFSMDVCLKDAYILDGFAGSGVIGLECLSRGAASCIFVEKDPIIQTILKCNIQKLHQEKIATVCGGFEEVGLSITKGFDFMYLDPPYDEINARGEPLYYEALKVLLSLMDSYTMTVIETRSTVSHLYIHDLPMYIVKQKTYGTVRLWFLKYRQCGT